MKDMKHYFAFIVLSLCTLNSAQADDLLEVYTVARENDAQLLAAEAAYNAALEAKPQARASLLPQLNASLNASKSKQKVSNSSAFIPDGTYDVNQKGYSLKLTQSLYNHQYWVQLRQADHSVAQAQAQVLAAREALMLRTAQAYFSVLGAQDSLEFAQAEREAIGRQLEQTQKRFEVGLIAITDVKESQASYDQSVAQEIVARNALDNTREALEVITGRAAGHLDPLSERLTLIGPEPQDMNKWVDTALKQNRQLTAAAFASQTARDEIARQRAGHYPTLDLFASSAYTDAKGGTFGGRQTDDTTVGIELNLPIFSGGRTLSQTRQARFSYQQAQQQYEFQRRDAVRNTRASYLNVMADISRVRAFNRVLESTQTAAEATQAGYDVGTRTSVDVLLTLRSVFQAKRDYARSRYDYVLDTLRLKQAAGTLDSPDIEAINKWLD